MDQSSRGDRPPNRPERTMSRYVNFTRSRVFQSMYRSNESGLTSISSSVRRGRRKTPLSPWAFALTAVTLVVGTYTLLQMRPVDFRGGELLDVVDHRSHGRQLPESMNPRTSPLLQVLDSTTNKVDGRMPWPSILTLHQPSNSATLSLLAQNVSSCIVTGYFRVESKHPSKSYDNWMKNMLSMRDCMVIFCEANMVPTMLELRAQRNESLTAVVAVDLDRLPIAQYFVPTETTATPDEFWQHQLDIDPEKRRHKSFKLFWIWLSKSWFVSTAAVLQHEIFGARAHDIDVWMWSDIGCFRNSWYNHKQLIRPNVDLTLFPDRETVVWMAHIAPNPHVNPFWGDKLNRHEKQHFFHSGSQAAAASVAAWTNFHRRFVETLDQTATQSLFVGEDQIVLQSTCLLHPSTCAYIPSNQVPDNNYFGLRYVLHHEVIDRPDGTRGFKGRNVQPFALWRPPPRLKATI